MNFNVNLGGVISVAIVVIYFLLDKYVFPLKVAKKQLIHKIQFEKEFETYKLLWEKLCKLRDMTERYILFPGSPGDQASGEAGVPTVRVRKEVGRNYIEAMDIIRDNKPFYEDKVYENANKLCRESLVRLFGVAEDEERNRSEFEDAVSELDKTIDEIEKAIRKRIGFS